MLVLFRVGIRGVFKTNREFWISASYVYSIFDFFCGIMLVHMFLIYADKYGHFECSINFWQLLCWHVFWGSSSIFAYSKKWIKESISNYMRGRIPNVDCGIWWSYLGPKQRLSVVQNVFRGPRRCERRRACRTPKHLNRRKHRWSEENSIGQ